MHRLLFITFLSISIAHVLAVGCPKAISYAGETPSLPAGVVVMNPISPQSLVAGFNIVAFTGTFSAQNSRPIGQETGFVTFTINILVNGVVYPIPILYNQYSAGNGGLWSSAVMRPQYTSEPRGCFTLAAFPPDLQVITVPYGSTTPQPFSFEYSLFVTEQAPPPAPEPTTTIAPTTTLAPTTLESTTTAEPTTTLAPTTATPTPTPTTTTVEPTTTLAPTTATPTSTTAPTSLPCTAATVSGRAGVKSTVHQLGQNAGVFKLEINSLFIPDRFEVYYEGVRIFVHNGFGIQSFSIAYGPGSATSVTVVVTGGSPITIWSYKIKCPITPTTTLRPSPSPTPRVVPVNTCCFKFTNPQLPSFNIPGFLSFDTCLSPSNKLQKSNGNSVSSCSGNNLEYWNGYQWKSTYVNAIGLHVPINEFYASGNRVYISSVRWANRNLEDVLSGKYVRLNMRCGSTNSCAMFMVNGTPQNSISTQCSAKRLSLANVVHSL